MEEHGNISPDELRSMARMIESAIRSGLVEDMRNAVPTTQHCCVCHRDCPIDSVYTGEAWQRMCPSCRRRYAELAKVMCLGCGRFLCFMKSGVTEDGYRVRPDETLHVRFCDNCDGTRARERKKAPIEEFERFAQVKRGNQLAGAIEADMLRKSGNVV